MDSYAFTKGAILNITLFTYQVFATAVYWLQAWLDRQRCEAEGRGVLRAPGMPALGLNSRSALLDAYLAITWIVSAFLDSALERDSAQPAKVVQM